MPSLDQPTQLPAKRVLFISNGHGEDLNASEVLRALRQKYPTVEVAALPIVGEGNAYRRLHVPIIAPTQALPSGGFVYMNHWQWVADLQAGLLSLVWQKIQALRSYAHHWDLVFATGDLVPLIGAQLTSCPYAAFLVSSSSHYEGQIQLPVITNLLLRSPRCQAIFTRDALTAKQLYQKGFSQAAFAGYPIMDVLTPTGADLDLDQHVPMIALLPGSRLPEACHNLGLQLELALAIAAVFAPAPIQFRAALVPSMIASQYNTQHKGAHGYTPLEEIATQYGWKYCGNGKLYHTPSNVTVFCRSDAFADILQTCDLAIGMAGTAVEQAVGLGKPVMQIVGKGPQFTYRFAEAQMRLLGESVQTIGKAAATPQTLIEAAQQVKHTLQNPDYLNRCVENGLERVGRAGGSAQIANQIARLLFS